MLSKAIWGLLSLSFAAESLHIPRGSSVVPGVYEIPIQQKRLVSTNTPSEISSRQLNRRGQTVLETLNNEFYLYFANISIGTPPQNVALEIDTGSSDLFVTYCHNQSYTVTSHGCYHPNASSSYKYLSSNFRNKFRDGAVVSGDFATEAVSIGGSAVKNQQFAISYVGDYTQGLLGVGYMRGEASVGSQINKEYHNLPQSLLDTGAINANAYSLWLNDYKANSGSILFGGIDTQKYTGPLQTLPVQKVEGMYQKFVLTVSQMAIIRDSSVKTLTTDLPVAVVIDSGCTFTYLPADLVASIYNTLNITTIHGEDIRCDCALGKLANTYVGFRLSTVTISIPIHDLVMQVPGSNQCVFGIIASTSGNNALGVTFLRSAYVVFDLNTNEISLAQTKVNSTSSNILAIKDGKNGVPGAIPVYRPVTAPYIGT